MNKRGANIADKKLLTERERERVSLQLHGMIYCSSTKLFASLSLQFSAYLKNKINNNKKKQFS